MIKLCLACAILIVAGHLRIAALLGPVIALPHDRPDRIGAVR